jgi:hypothetical protein
MEATTANQASSSHLAVVSASGTDSTRVQTTTQLSATIIEDSFSGEHGYVWLVLVILGYAFALFIIFVVIWIIWYGATLRERRRFTVKQRELTNSPDLNDIDVCGPSEHQTSSSVHPHHSHRLYNPSSEINTTIATSVGRPIIQSMASSISANSTLCRPLDSQNQRNNKRVITNCTYAQHLFNNSNNANSGNLSHKHLINPNSHFSLDVTNSPYTPRATISKCSNGRRSTHEEEDMSSIYSNPRKVAAKSSLAGTMREKSATLAAQQAQRSNYCKYRL